MVAYFCYHLSDIYYVVFSDLSVDLSDLYVVTYSFVRKEIFKNVFSIQISTKLPKMST